MVPRTDDDIRKLKQDTEGYWRQLGKAQEGDRLGVWQAYVRDLLSREMEGKVAPNPCHTLVCLVGHSVEPLLQSVWVYQPAKVLLLLSKQYGRTLSGPDLAKQIRSVLECFPQDRRVSHNAVRHQVVEATPAAIFQTLVKQVGKSQGVVVDITGAKKSMVAGAFLYAAYADVPVSYVDFDDADYSAGNGRPYGYATEIRSFGNPYETFSLRDWERVQQLYKAYRFREARRLLEEEIKPMIIGSYFSDSETGQNPALCAVEALESALRCYEAWDAGDFGGTYDLAFGICCDKRPFEVPTVVTTLHDVWPATIDGDADVAVKGLIDQHGALSTGQGDCAHSFYCRDDLLLTYADDELARIRRLIDYNEDYRSAFLRAASLNEVLLKARVAGLRGRGSLVDDTGKLVTFDYLVDKATATEMLDLLTTGRSKKIHGEMKPGIPRLRPFWDGGKLDLKTAITLRNKTVHTYLAVPLEIARAAWELACANLKDYRAHWLTGEDTTTVVEVMAWRDLCLLCGADEFLTPNLLAQEVMDEVFTGG